jgi:Flp pilus assembly protein TadD
LFGLNPAGHHLVNILIHATNTALLFLALRNGTGALWRSAAAAALFGVHPLRVESVAWVAERKDVLSAFFLIVILLVHLHYARRPGWKRFVPVWLLLIVGLMAKPMLVTVPIVLLLLDFWPLGRVSVFTGSPRGNLAGCLLEKATLLPLVAASSLMTVYAQSKGGALASLGSADVPDRLGRALVACAQYLGKLLWPVHLAVYYPIPTSTAYPTLHLIIAGGTLTAISAIAFVRLKSQPYILLGWLWYLTTILPVVGLVQVGGQAMADRYTYIPLVGIVLAIVWLAADSARSRPHLEIPLALLFTVILAGLAARTIDQIQLWRDDAALFQHTLNVTKDNWFVENNLGMILDKRGHQAEARAHILEALRIKPDYAIANFNLGFILVREGDLNRAVGYLRQGLLGDPTFTLAANRLAGTLLTLGRADEAKKVLADILVLRPDYALGHSNLGSILHRQGRFTDAVRHYREALNYDPTLSNARGGLANAERGLPP